MKVRGDFNFLCLILSGDREGLQQYMWFCKLQSVLHVQHDNKVLNPGLSVSAYRNRP